MTLNLTLTRESKKRHQLYTRVTKLKVDSFRTLFIEHHGDVDVFTTTRWESFRIGEDNGTQD